MLSPTQRQTLSAICDTVCRTLTADEKKQLVAEHALSPDHANLVEAFCDRAASATELGVPAAVESAIAKHMLPAQIRELGFLLALLGSAAGNMVLCGHSAPFHELSLAAREEALNGLRTSMLWPKRKAFLALKAVVGLKYMSVVAAAAAPGAPPPQNPNWAAIGFDPPPVEHAATAAAAAGRTEPRYQMLNELIGRDATWGGDGGDEQLTFDVVVVGSGCGGSVVTAELAVAGLRVLVLEKGSYRPRAALRAEENDAFDHMYERGALLQTEDTGISVLAGSTFGGGSAINWAWCAVRSRSRDLRGLCLLWRYYRHCRYYRHYRDCRYSWGLCLLPVCLVFDHAYFSRSRPALAARSGPRTTCGESGPRRTDCAALAGRASSVHSSTSRRGLACARRASRITATTRCCWRHARSSTSTLRWRHRRWPMFPPTQSAPAR